MSEVPGELEELAIDRLREQWLVAHPDAPRPLTTQLTERRSVRLLSGREVVAELSPEDLDSAIAALAPLWGPVLERQRRAWGSGSPEPAQIGSLAELGCSLRGCVVALVLIAAVVVLGWALKANPLATSAVALVVIGMAVVVVYARKQ